MSFRFVGAGVVVRANVARTMKAAFLVVRPDSDDKRTSGKLDIKTFDRDLIRDVGRLSPGDVVEVEGDVTIEAVADRNGHKITIDGWERWVPMLKMDKLTICPPQEAERSGEQQELDKTTAPKTSPDDDIPF